MARRALATQSFSGKSLEEIHTELVAFLDAAESPPRLEDALTKLGYYDPFAREAIKRSFILTLKPGGVNERLTTEKRWLRNREKWADGVVDSGKINLTFIKTTVPTDKLALRLEELNGQLSDDVRDTIGNFAAIVADRANQKFDKNTVAFLVEDMTNVVGELAAVTRENQLHEKYRQQNEQQMTMMQALVAELTGRRTGITPSAE